MCSSNGDVTFPTDVAPFFRACSAKMRPKHPHASSKRQKLSHRNGKSTLNLNRWLRIIISSGQSYLTIRCIAAAHGRYSLYFTMDGSFPSKLPLLMGIWTPSNTWFLWPTRVHNPRGISIGSAVLQCSRSWHLWQIDHATSVTVGRIYTYVVLRCRLKRQELISRWDSERQLFTTTTYT